MDVCTGWGSGETGAALSKSISVTCSECGIIGDPREDVDHGTASRAIQGLRVSSGAIGEADLEMEAGSLLVWMGHRQFPL